jgi:hypothetical protein
MNKPEEKLELHIRPRATQTVSIDIPIDTLRSLEKVAVSEDIALERAIKEGENTETVSREAIFQILESKG